jgi:plastocyanin
MTCPIVLRYSAIALLLFLSLPAGASGPGGIEVRGTARAGNRPVAHAVVWLDAPNLPPSRASMVILDQRNLTFSPQVLVVRVGTNVEFPNNDRVFHNVFSFRDGKPFDLGMYPVGTKRLVTFDRPGLSRIFCNIHPNMAAYVMVVDTPYFGLSDERGAFTIPSVPPRSYTYHAWRAGAPEVSGQLVAAGGTPLVIDWP